MIVSTYMDNITRHGNAETLLTFKKAIETKVELEKPIQLQNFIGWS